MPTLTLGKRLLAGAIFTGLAAAAFGVITQQVAAQKAAPPDFSANQAGWVTMGGDLVPVPGSPKPITWDPAHPYVPNNIGKQPTYRIADLRRVAEISDSCCV